MKRQLSYLDVIWACGMLMHYIIGSIADQCVERLEVVKL